MTKILGYREHPLKIENENSEQVGWDWNARSYVFGPIKENKPGMITTAAVMMCSDCGTIIKSMGGPGRNCYCNKCYEALKVADFANGQVHKIEG